MGFVRRRISEHPEESLHKFGEASLFTPVAVGAQIVDSDAWSLTTKRQINQGRSVRVHTGFRSEFVRYAFLVASSTAWK